MKDVDWDKIDNGMISLIKELRSKGYETTACCSGNHPNQVDLDPLRQGYFGSRN